MHFICVANGPSLTLKQIRHAGILRQTMGCRVITISDAMYVCAFADIGYAADRKWWAYHCGMPLFRGLKFSVGDTPFTDVIPLKKTGDRGFDPEPGNIRTGQNSGFQAVHLAAQHGAKRITLLGYDFSNPDGAFKQHWFGLHPDGMNRESDMDRWRREFRELTDELNSRSILIENATEGGTIDWLPKIDVGKILEDALRTKGKPAPG